MRKISLRHLFYFFILKFLIPSGMAQTNDDMITKKLYVDENHIYEIIYIPIDTVNDYKEKYQAHLIKDSSTAVLKYRLKNGMFLFEFPYEAYAYSEECEKLLKKNQKQYFHSSNLGLSIYAFEQMYFSQNYLSQVDSLIFKLSKFIGIDVTVLDKSIASIEIINNHFETYDQSIGLELDFVKPLTIYFGEVLIKQYPEFEWKMKEIKDFNSGEIYYEPYLTFNDIVVEFHRDIGYYLAGEPDEYGQVPIINMLRGRMNYINRVLKK